MSATRTPSRRVLVENGEEEEATRGGRERSAPRCHVVTCSYPTRFLVLHPQVSPRAYLEAPRALKSEGLALFGR